MSRSLQIAILHWCGRPCMDQHMPKRNAPWPSNSLATRRQKPTIVLGQNLPHSQSINTRGHLTAQVSLFPVASSPWMSLFTNKSTSPGVDRRRQATRWSLTSPQKLGRARARCGEPPPGRLHSAAAESRRPRVFPKGPSPVRPVALSIGANCA